ncbi:hypothetical protein [Fimbriimonas ginsengisoli]|uniref:Lipoprotein n=1 Tax=Fimbriimonas ginsengisoli Gsoil 348 TaxID=661478 RepID=A0A068NLU5_FIMGI|nr:hypothetical protein [Fimbriimonas ginsengisoli]AIE84518.1 hypothetical protein OP10G_1150 [Fimbriimonas ginsengisoli Gsoil 348]
MRNLALFLVTVLALASTAGCNSKTPEEVEASKYPQVKPLSPAEEKAARERLHLGGPLTEPKKP